MFHTDRPEADVTRFFLQRRPKNEIVLLLICRAGQRWRQQKCLADQSSVQQARKKEETTDYGQPFCYYYELLFFVRGRLKETRETGRAEGAQS